MKPLLLLPLLALVSYQARAQETYEKLVPTDMDAVLKNAPFYKSRTDTTKVRYQLTGNERAHVVGRLAPNWAIVSRDGFLYYMPARYLDGFSTVPGTPAWIDAVSELPKDAQGHIIYLEVVPMEGVSQNELYNRAKVWFASTFRSAQNIIQADDKEAGLLVGKRSDYVYFQEYYGLKETVRFTVKLSFKDGRYRYELTDFAFQAPVSAYNSSPDEQPAEIELSGELRKNGKPNQLIVEEKTGLNHIAKSMLRGLKVAMQKPAAGGDW